MLLYHLLEQLVAHVDHAVVLLLLLLRALLLLLLSVAHDKVLLLGVLLLRLGTTSQIEERVVQRGA